GGSASAAAGAMAAGLATMVAGMSRGKKAYVQHESRLSAALARLGTLKEDLKAAIDADAESYNAVMKAYKEAKTAPNGEELIQAALKGATAVPFMVAEKSAEVGTLAKELRPITNPNMASDLTVAASLARTAVEGALANVEINLTSITDAGFVASMRQKTASLPK